MLWQDILVDRHFDDGALIELLASVLSIHQSDVRVVHDAADIPDVTGEGTRLVAEVTRIRGDFVQGIQIYVLDGALEQWLKRQDERTLLAQFCKAGQCNALLDDGSENPYSWLLIGKAGEIRPVVINAERLALGEYVIEQGPFANIATGD